MSFFVVVLLKDYPVPIPHEYHGAASRVLALKSVVYQCL